MPETGRSSTNILKPPLRPWKCGISFQTLTKGGIGEEVRSLYIAEPGYSFLEADLSQVEARICMLLSNDFETLKKLEDPGYDMHKVLYRDIAGLESGAEVTKNQRYLGKQIRYAVQYGTGAETFTHTVNSDAKKWGIKLEISFSQGKKLLETAHSKMPNIKGVFHHDVREALLSNRKTLISPTLPFGPKQGRRRTFFDRPGEDLYREAYAQIPQSTPPDHIRRCYLFDIQPKLKFGGSEEKLRLCGEAHDALLFKCKEGFEEEAYKMIKASFETEIDFSECSIPRGKIRIPAELKIGSNYKEMRAVNELSGDITGKD